jgi:Icc-related predicted phosphoesterase
MRLVITSDTHGKHENLALPSGDVLIHCGDFCDGFNPDESDLNRIDRWFGRLEFDHILCIGGNHDFVAQDRSYDPESMFEHATYLQDSEHVIDGVRFYGAPWIPQLQGWAYYLSDDQLRDKWAMIPIHTDVLITHTPPWHILDSPRNRTIRAGCAHLAARIDNLNLKIHCFGHIHASYGRLDHNRTIFLNASAVNSNFEIANEPFVIDLP